MKRSAEREMIFRLLFMSEFYDKKDLGDELVLYFDSPYPFSDDEDEETKELIEKISLKESVNDDDRQRLVARYIEVIDKLDEIDDRISKVSKGWSIDRIGKVELAAIRLGIYEALYDDTVPVSVAINEAVELTKKFGPEGSYAFVNGILAKFA
ncbi:MAG: transcription antitermination factor NusB [Lachnospiraceae bacterium]|nr:transcription antitermination factor NusB [Lachnospiraceae bacterium]